MREEEKYFDFKDKANKYVAEQERKGRKLLHVSYRKTSFIASIFGAWGYIYTFIWDK